MKRLFLWLVVAGVGMTAMAQEAVSPNGKIRLKVKNDGRCVVSYQKQQVLEVTLPFTTNDLKGKQAQRVKADYTMFSGKRSHCVNEANEYRVGQVTLRLYNDGLAYRYETPVKEQAAYIIPEGMKRWMQQWADSYEGFFPLSTTCKQKAVPSYGRQYKDAEGNCVRWGYPALVEAPMSGKGGEPVFALLTEANMEKGQSASSLYNEGEVFRVVPDEGENLGHSPWRVVIIGSLAEVVQSTLVTDVAAPCKLEDVSWIQPGVVSWIYWAYNHGSNDYDIIKKYVDMAVSLKLPYVLIDAEWDQMKAPYTIEDVIDYAKSKGVRPLIWYNSSVGWVDGAPTPKFRLNKPEDCEKEFAWCEKMGVAGVKIDFFSGDTQRNIDYCIDLLECAARHHLLVNFHGATVPRGWQRTYPNLMSTEGVYGAEWYNNVPTFTDKAACHNATLPFTRNVIGPMDYTPCTFSDSQHPHITTHGHELALTVLYESALQHLADRPESYLSQPAEVQQFLSDLPSVWDETRLVSGYPGESVVMARRFGTTWYVAGINGTNNQMTLKTPLGFIPQGVITLYADGEPWAITQLQTLPPTISCKPRGGFVMVVSQKAGTLPLVYDVENTGAAFAKPNLPAADKLPVQHGLPNALEGVKQFSDWSKRRSEIAAQIQHYGIGEKPAVSKESVKARMDGDTLIVDVTVNGQTLTLKSEIQYPKTGKAPYALMIGTSGIALPKQLFEDRPIARMVFREKQVNDYGQWGKHHERGEHNFDRLYPQLKDNGAYSEWAWGLSRLIDGLQQLGPEVTKIAPRHIGVTGCSYAGKMALYCGAFDERVALVIAQEPGGGGAASWRASHETPKNVENIDKTDYHWFMESQKENFHGDSVYRLPYDQHELCAMVFPRALLLLGNPDYEWLADESMLVSAKAAREVWRRFGVSDRMGWSILGGHGHCQLPERQFPEVEAFIDKFLLGRNTDTRDIRIADFSKAEKNK
jgi:hypothetical protein